MFCFLRFIPVLQYAVHTSNNLTEFGSAVLDIFVLCTLLVYCTSRLPRYLKDCTLFRVWSPIRKFRIWCEQPIIVTYVFNKFNFIWFMLKADCLTFMISASSPSDAAVCEIACISMPVGNTYCDLLGP